MLCFGFALFLLSLRDPSTIVCRGLASVEGAAPCGAGALWHKCIPIFLKHACRVLVSLLQQTVKLTRMTVQPGEDSLWSPVCQPCVLPSQVQACWRVDTVHMGRHRGRSRSCSPRRGNGDRSSGQQQERHREERGHKSEKPRRFADLTKCKAP